MEISSLLPEGLDEHFFESCDTLVSKKNQAIMQSGKQPQILLLEEGIQDEAIAFHKELYWIHYWAAQGKPLRNREAQRWFRERYDDTFGRSGKASSLPEPRQQRPKASQTIPALRPETYGRIQALCPTLDQNDIAELEATWRTWLATPGKTPPRQPDAAFIAFCQRKLEG